jgi:conjugal transfer pilus assembly protein TrbC
VALCTVAGAPRLSAAQAAPPAVTDADIARAAKTQPVISDQEIERAAKKHRMPSDAELARVPVPSTPKVDALPQPLTQRHVDLGAIARGYEAMGQPSAGTSALASGPSLLIFVSFSMPEPTLGRLVDQAARAGGTLVLRGLVDNSLQKTVVRVQRLIGERKVGFQIDPQAFDRFSVAATPTFVLIKDGAVPAPCAAGTCFPATSFVSTAGDVSLDYALEFFDRAAPSFGPAAQSFLSKLKGR